VKGDYGRAEEYYSRAILADPNDGELLSEYAKLVWDVHRDGERASSYFEQAARASPQNRCVHFTPSNSQCSTDSSMDSDRLFRPRMQPCPRRVPVGHGRPRRAGLRRVRSCSFVSGVADNLNAASRVPEDNMI
jgi:tetratricopeptide (TPR) repeat protein